MGRLDPEARMTIKALAARGTTRSGIARLLGVIPNPADRFGATARQLLAATAAAAPINRIPYD